MNMSRCPTSWTWTESISYILPTHHWCFDTEPAEQWLHPHDRMKSIFMCYNKNPITKAWPWPQPESQWELYHCKAAIFDLSEATVCFFSTNFCKTRWTKFYSWLFQCSNKDLCLNIRQTQHSKLSRKEKKTSSVTFLIVFVRYKLTDKLLL